jgi:hypothetical protein
LDRFGARHDGGSIQEVEREIEAGRAWFWPAERSAAVLQMAKECHVWLAGGDLGEMLHTLPQIEDWATAQDCDRMTIIGRRGWEKVLAPHGYRSAPMLVKGL